MTSKRRPEAAGRTYGGESAAERQARQRQQFMAAGRQMFGSVGYRATTVRTLCKQAGLIDRYFYKNFVDTEDLLAAVYAEAIDDIQATVMRALMQELPGGHAERIVTAGVGAFFTSFENPEVARICWLEVLGVSARIDALYIERIQRFADLLITLARTLVPDMKLHPDDMQFTGFGLVGAVSQSALQWLLSGYRADRQHLVAANTRLLLGAVQMLRS